MKHTQIAIIGGGVIGSSIAWELSKFNVSVIVFEKGSDVASGASKANSGVIHSGINSPYSSLKSRFCIEGNNLIQSLANDLGFSLKWVGKYVIAKNEDEIKALEKLKKNGQKNGIPLLEIHEKTIVQKNEPYVSCYAGLWVPTAGIVLPYEFTISLAENAAINGVNFLLETKVEKITKQDGFFIIETNKGIYQSDIVINAAGVNCREIVSVLENPDFQIYPCRGEYLVLDKNYRHLVTSMIYPIPIEELGVLGVHITPTIEGNILVGPSAEFIDDLDDRRTTKKTMNILFKEAKEIIRVLPKKAVISSYSGIRCKLSSLTEGGWSDYRIDVSKSSPGLINLIGIESPGLTSAPSIAKEIVIIISKFINMEVKENVKIKKREKRFIDLSKVDQEKLINKNERWGRIVCRCEHITEAEVINALSNPLGATSLSSIKYRCRAGMGRCQGGFCLQHMVRIMEKEFHMNFKDLKMNSPKSYLFARRNRKVSNDYR